jgi:glycosyltransferase involved in cell wall biosynthesis
MHDPLVSVIVPSYNAAPFLNELLGSLQEQAYRHFEALVLDDGSQDNTQQVFDAYRSDARFQFFQWFPNRGVTAATCDLLRRMQGTFWCYPGADDVLHSDFLRKRVAALEANPRAVIVHGPPQLIDAGGNDIAGRLAPEPMPSRLGDERALRVLLEHNIINTPSVLVRASVTKQLLPLLERGWRYAQDWYFWLLHLTDGAELLWDSERLHKYRVHTGSLMNDPAKIAVREAETRLVPLCGLSAAAELSATAAKLWDQWGRVLYCLWLRRAFRLFIAAQLNCEWVNIGAAAYHNQSVKRSLFSELMHYAPGVIANNFRENKARARTSFNVSGLAQIADSLFN